MAKIEKRDHGKLLIVDCPECKKNSEYRLFEEVDFTPLYLKILFVKDQHTWFIKCSNCSHSVNVPEEEAARIPIINEAGIKMEKGEISSEEFYSLFGQFSFIVELLNQAHAWECPLCAENISWNYQVCWNCNTPNPELADKPVSSEPRFVQPSCGFNVIQQ